MTFLDLKLSIAQCLVHSGELAQWLYPQHMHSVVGHITLVVGTVQGMVSEHPTGPQVLWELLWSSVEGGGHGVHRRWPISIICIAGAVHGMLGFAAVALEPVWVIKSSRNIICFVILGGLGSLRYSTGPYIAGLLGGLWLWDISHVSVQSDDSRTTPER